MSISQWRPFKLKFKAMPGIRARLVLLAMILVVPLMFDRIRLLEDSRHRELLQAQDELSEVARHTANAQREIVASVQAILKSAAYIYASSPPERSCAIMRASLLVDLPWIRTLTILGPDGKAECSTSPAIVGLDLSDRDYYKRARELHEFVLSDYIFSRRTELPTVVAAYPISAIEGNAEAVVVAAVDLNWISQILSARTDRAGLTTLMIDGAGTILAAQTENIDLVGKKLQDTALLESAMRGELDLAGHDGPFTLKTVSGGTKAVSLAGVAGTSARIVLITDQNALLKAVNANIQRAYLELAVVLLTALLGGWVVGERLIIKPLDLMTSMARRFGSGDLSARAARSSLPHEFAPLAEAFNNMADQLGERERQLLASNNQLTVMASNDFLSGLANRRGFQTRLDFEWMKALQTGHLVSLLMIDVDHFKLFNDTYGHPEGDACLGQLGEVLAGIAADVSGFAARYGGEEFCLLLPDTDSAAAVAVGERVRAAIENLAIVNSQSPTKAITVSVGTATTTPGSSGNCDLIDAADVALYAAKRRGRNTVVEHSLIRIEDSALLRAS